MQVESLGSDILENREFSSKSAKNEILGFSGLLGGQFPGNLYQQKRSVDMNIVLKFQIVLMTIF